MPPASHPASSPRRGNTGAQHGREKRGESSITASLASLKIHSRQPKKPRTIRSIFPPEVLELIIGQAAMGSGDFTRLERLAALSLVGKDWVAPAQSLMVEELAFSEDLCPHFLEGGVANKGYRTKSVSLFDMPEPMACKILAVLSGVVELDVDHITAAKRSNLFESSSLSGLTRLNLGRGAYQIDRSSPTIRFGKRWPLPLELPFVLQRFSAVISPECTSPCYLASLITPALTTANFELFFFEAEDAYDYLPIFLQCAPGLKTLRLAWPDFGVTRPILDFLGHCTSLEHFISTKLFDEEIHPDVVERIPSRLRTWMVTCRFSVSEDPRSDAGEDDWGGFFQSDLMDHHYEFDETLVEIVQVMKRNPFSLSALEKIVVMMWDGRARGRSAARVEMESLCKARNIVFEIRSGIGSEMVQSFADEVERRLPKREG